jgi:hypothetical protein
MTKKTLDYYLALPYTIELTPDAGLLQSQVRRKKAFLGEVEGRSEQLTTRKA